MTAKEWMMKLNEDWSERVEHYKELRTEAMNNDDEERMIKINSHISCLSQMRSELLNAIRSVDDYDN